MSGWRKNEDGDWVWPLHPTRRQDYLHVWQDYFARPVFDNVVSFRQDEWRGALIINGNHLHACQTRPCATAEQAKAEVFGMAFLYVGVLSGSLAEVDA